MQTTALCKPSALKQRAARLGVGLSLAVTLALGAVMPALAADPGLTITGTPVSATAGTITYNIDGAGSSAANTIALDGKAHSIAIAVPIAATDHSGNDLGWNTTISLAAFKTNGNVLLGEGALAVSAAASAACDTSDNKVCSNSNAAVTNAVSPTTYTTGGGAIKVFSTDADTHDAGVGMGQYTYNTTFTLNLPSTAKAGSYTSTMTVTAVSAP